ncbi:hypothetical protein Tco_0694841 [Tanacetum coccineum]
MHKSLELEKNKAEAALLKAQPSFPNVEQLNELMVKSLQTEFSKILSSHDFSSSLPTELKDFPSKFNELTKEIKGLKTQVYELEIELPKELKEIPTQLEDFTKTATSLTSQVAELKTLYLLLNVIKALNKFVKVLESTSTKAGDQSFPSAGQADTMLAEGEKDTNQATISQLFQRRAEKIGEHIKKDKGKKVMSSDEAEKESTETHSIIRRKINNQKKLEEAKAEAAKQEGGDPLDKLNNLANKKRKHTDDIHDYLKATKRLKLLDFVTIEDLEDFSNVMLYTVQEIFFRRHQGLGWMIILEPSVPFCFPKLIKET